jgi:NAD(P)-dependent dehydrogenase (short-subunit alcohol dehydrogenase family)
MPSTTLASTAKAFRSETLTLRTATGLSASILNGVLYGMRFQIPAILASGAAEGAIVNIASIHGAVACPGYAAYTASKHGVVGLTRNAAAEYGAQGLRINAIGPGYINTPMMAPAPEELVAAFVAKHPLGRLGDGGDRSRDHVPPLRQGQLHDRHVRTR